MKQILLCLSLALFSLNVNSQETAYYCPPCNMECDNLKFDEAGNCSQCGMRLVEQTEEQRANTMRAVDMTIGFYLQDGVEVLDFAGPMEVFAYAGFNVITIAKTKEPITSQGILRIIPDYSIDDAPQVDVLAFFGGGAGRASRDEAVLDWIKSREETEYHFSVCTGAFFLGRAGLLDGQSATTFHGAIDDLRELLPETNVLANARWVDNGHIITTAGVSAGIDGALHFVEKFMGTEAAERVTEYMEYDKWEPDDGVVVD